MKRVIYACLPAILFIACAQLAFAQLADSCWPKFHCDYAGTGQGQFGGASADISWTFSAGGAIKSAPVIGPGGVIYFTCANGHLYGLTGGGGLIFDVSTINCAALLSPAIGADGTIYVATSDGYLCSVTPAGVVKSKRSLGVNPTTSVVITRSGNVLVGCGNVIKSMVPGGTPTIFYTAGGAISSTPAIGPDGCIYFGCQDSKVYAVNSNGSLKWAKSFSGSGKFFASPAIGSDGTIYIGSQYGFYAIQSADGSQKWKKTVGSSVTSSAAVSPTGFVSFGCEDYKVYFKSTATGNDTAPPYLTGGQVNSSPAIGADGNIYVGSLDGNIYSIGSGGNLNWNKQTGGPVNSSPAIGPAGALIVGSDNGTLYCFAADKTAPSAPVVTDDGLYTSYADHLHGSWEASDAESGIYQYEYCIGTAPGLADIAGWQGAMGTYATRNNLTLLDKHTYYITVHAINGAGMAGPDASSDGIIIDASPATTPVITDDGVYTSNPTTLHAVWSSQDPESGIAGYQYSIGTRPGGTDLIGWTSQSAASINLFGLALANGTTYYVNVKALNNGGAYSQVGSSDGIKVDITVPNTPVVKDTGQYISDLHSISATWSALDTESGIAKYEYSVGTVPGGMQIRSWQSAGTNTSAVIAGLNLTNGGTYYVNVRATNGAGLMSDIGSTDGAVLDSTPPAKPVVTDDGVFTASTSELHASWLADDLESGIKTFKIAIGTTPGGTDLVGWYDVGLVAEFKLSDLILSQGQVYYFSIIAVNNAMAESQVGTSDGITVDTTAPTKPVVTDDGNTTYDHTQLHATWTSEDSECGIAGYDYSIGTSAGATDVAGWMDAGNNTSITRSGLQLQDLATYYINVRARNTLGVVSEVGSSDGILVDSMSLPAPTVTDDGQFTSSTTALHATWSGVTPPSDVASYEYSIGTAAEATDVNGWTNVGLETQATATGLTLAHGRKYYINVRAISIRGRAGLIGISDGITVDATPPTTPAVIDGGTYTSSSSQLYAGWSASDADSGVVEYKYAIGTTPGAVDLVGWTSAGTVTSKTITGLTLVDGKTYYISVKAKNAAGGESAAGTSDGIFVDLTPPTKPTVTDDGAYVIVTNPLHASWSSTDPQTGVVKYEYSIGTSAGATNTLAWTDAGTKTEATITGLTLSSATRYFINVRATNGAGTVSQVGSSDGIYVETTPPTTPVVTDGGKYTKSTTSLNASWIASDLESGIAKYDYSIGTAVGRTDIVAWTNAGTATSMSRNDLSLIHGQSYYINVKATNNAGLASQVGSSDGILVDTTPPSAPAVTDSGAYTADTTKLTVNATCSDAESGIASYEYAVGTTANATDIKNWTQDGAGPGITITGLSLTTGVTYYVSVRAINGAGLTGPAGTTDGIKVDATSPVNVTVTDDGEFTGSASSIHGSWSASDPESGIAKYKYCVGTAPGLADVAGWLDVGNATENIRTGLSLVTSKSYYISVIATNGAGGESVSVSSNGIKVDTSAPVTPVVTDAGKYWGFRTSLGATWQSSDPESGVVDYQFAIGTSAGAADVASWQSVGNTTSYIRTGLMLQDGVTYYINIKAKNGAGTWSAAGSSDGIMIDSTPPTTPVVVDDGDTTSMLDRLHCTWHSADPESGIEQYMYCIGTSPGAVDVLGWTSSGISEEVTVADLQLDPVLRYYFSVKAKSKAGAWSAVSASDGIGFSSGAAIWARFRNDALNRGRGLFNATTVKDVAWSIPTQGYVESSPAIAADGTTYIGSGDGKLYAITQNGTIRWTYDTGASIDSSPAIAPDGSIVFGCGNGNVYCLNPGGEKVWEYQTNAEVRSSPLIANNLVYVGSQDGGLYAIGLANGIKVWCYSTGGGIWSSPAIDAAGVIYVGSEDAYLYAINPDGSKKWRFSTGSAIDSSPAIGNDGTIYIGSGDGHFYAVNPNNTLKWKKYFGAVADSSAAIGPDGNIYVASGVDGGAGTVYSLKPDGAERWKYVLPVGGTNGSPAIDPAGRIYVGSSDEYLYAFNPDGTVCFKFKTGSSVASSPALGADSSVVFGSYDGYIYCLRDITSKDLTPPTTPVVSVPNSHISAGAPLVASWSASDPESMVAEYTYAIGTTPGGSDVAGWASAGIETSISKDDMILELGKTYYVSVKARNPAQRWSAVGVSPGVTVAPEGFTNNISGVKYLSDDASVSLNGKVVTMVFSDCFFIEEPNRSAGIRCAGAPGALKAGDIVDVTGSMFTTNGEKVISEAVFTVNGSTTPLAPLGICGNIANMRGLDPTGLYVTVWGKVSSVQTGYFVLDGGYGLQTNGANGIGIQAPGDSVTIGGFVSAKGVLCREMLGGNAVITVRVAPSGGVSVVK